MKKSFVSSVAGFVMLAGHAAGQDVLPWENYVDLAIEAEDSDGYKYVLRGAHIGSFNTENLKTDGINWAVITCKMARPEIWDDPEDEAVEIMVSSNDRDEIQFYLEDKAKNLESKNDFYISEPVLLDRDGNVTFLNNPDTVRKLIEEFATAGRDHTGIILPDAKPGRSINEKTLEDLNLKKLQEAAMTQCLAIY